MHFIVQSLNHCKKRWFMSTNNTQKHKMIRQQLFREIFVTATSSPSLFSSSCSSNLAIRVLVRRAKAARSISIRARLTCRFFFLLGGHICSRVRGKVMVGVSVAQEALQV